MVHSINVYLDSFKIFDIGLHELLHRAQSNTLPLNIENSGAQWTKLYILLQTRQRCYASFWLILLLAMILKRSHYCTKWEHPMGLLM